MELQAARLEIRRQWKREQYRKQLPLSVHKRLMAIAVWFEAGELVCMGLRYLEMAYMNTIKRCGSVNKGRTGSRTTGVVHHEGAPPHWKTFFFNHIDTLTDEDKHQLRVPTDEKVHLHQKAKRFLMEVALVDYVRSKNQHGLTVSSRAVLERRGFLLDLLAVQSQSRLKKLPRQGPRWVKRWQQRHALTRGRFRLGCGITPDQQHRKVGGWFQKVALVFPPKS